MASDLGARFASFHQVSSTPISIEVRAGDFPSTFGAPLVGFVSHAEDAGPAPRPIVSLGGSLISPLLASEQLADSADSVALFELHEGNYELTVNGTASSVDVLLLGDFDGDYDVDDADLATWIDGASATLGKPLGDYNSNGVVDAADYIVWRRNLGTIPDLAGTNGDGDLSGQVEQFDYKIWRANFGATGVQSATGGPIGDADFDGDADAQDAALLKANYGVATNLRPEFLSLSIDGGVLDPSTGVTHTNSASVPVSGSTEPNALVQFDLDDDGQFDDASTTAASDGSFFLSVPLQSGQQKISARSESRFGHKSLVTRPVHYEASFSGAPIVQAKLEDDTGVSSADSITNDATIVGVVSSDEEVTSLTVGIDTGNPSQFFDVTANLSNGNFEIPETLLESLGGGPLSQGSHTIRFQAEGADDGLSAVFELQFEYDSVAPALPVIDLNARSDSGISSTDNITNENRPETTVRLLNVSPEFEQYGVGEGLVTVDPLNGAVTDVADTDIFFAVDFRSDGVLYGVSAGTTLETINPTTGETTTIGDLPELMVAISFNPDGRLFAVSNGGATLYELDAEDGSEISSHSITGTLDANGGSLPGEIQGIEFAPNGMLYAVGFGLYTLDVDSGVASRITPSGSYAGPGSRFYTELDYSDTGQLRAVSTDSRYDLIDPATGLAFAGAPTSQLIRGIASAPSGLVPAEDLEIDYVVNGVKVGTKDANLAATFVSPRLEDGDYLASATARDLAGNMSVSMPLNLTVDTDAPTQPLFDLASGSDTGALGDRQTTMAVVSFSGSTEPFAQLEVLELGEHLLAGASGAFSITDVELDIGSNLLGVRASDLAGNQSGFRRSFTRIDNAANVAFGDSDLEEAVRQALSLSPSELLTQEQMLALTTLSADASVIDSLNGLEFATNLETLQLIAGDLSSPGGVASLAPLLDLPQLSHVTLVGAGISESQLATLDQLQSLIYLDVRNSGLTDLTFIDGLLALETLKVYGNDFTTLSPLWGRPLVVDVAPVGLEYAQSISELAAALHYSPLEMFEFVHNNIEYEAYTGAMKGPQATLESGGGNAWDQASLLIELMEEAGLDARFGTGRITAPLTDVQSWLGVNNLVSAVLALDTAKLNYGLAFPDISFDHAWAEVLLDTPDQGPQWVSLDPSWKFKDRQEGIPGLLQAVAFDEAAYLSEVQSVRGYEFYAEQVQDYLDANMPGKTLADVPYDGPIVPVDLEAIPATLPYAIEGTPTSYQELPTTMTHQVVVSIFGPGSQLLLGELFALPEISQDQITISWADLGGGMLTPQLRLNGQVFSTGTAVDEGTAIGVHVVQFEPGDLQQDRTVTFNIRAGRYIALGIDANQFTPDLLASRQQTLNDATFQLLNGQAASEDDYLGGFLSLAISKFFYETDKAEDLINDITYTVGAYNELGFGVASSDRNFSLHPELPIAVIPERANVDVQWDSYDPIPADFEITEPAVSRGRILYMSSSSQEHALWEELVNTPSISTVKSLQLANERNIPIFEIDSSNIDTLLPQLTQSATVIQIVQDSVADGSSVLIPRDPTPLLDWQGVGFLITNATTGAYSTLITGSIPAGSASAISGGSTGSFNPDGPTGVTPGNHTSRTERVDPVDVANGNLARDELDIDLPNIGMPLQLTRHYSAQQTEDVGFGPGWSHSFSDFLTVENDGTVVWTTATQIRHHFTPDGVGGYINPDKLFGTLSTDAGGFVYEDKHGLTRRFDSAGRLVEIVDRNLNGLALNYDGLGQLLSVADRHDPARSLTFAYGSGLISAVTDFTGRTWNYTYSPEGLLASVTTPGGASTLPAVVTYNYYADAARFGLMQSITQPDGGVLSYSYLPDGRVFQVFDALGGNSTFFYDIYRKRTVLVDEQGNWLEDFYDDDGVVVRTIHPDYSDETSVYQDQLLLQHTDQAGNTRHMVYDSLGNVTEMTDRDGTVTTYTYDSYSNVTQIVRPGGRATTYGYDANGNRTLVVDAEGGQTTSTYDGRGLRTSTTSPLGNQTPTVGDYTTTFTYNAAGQVETIQTDLPTLESFTYDDAGNVTSVTDANGHATAFTYDLLNRLLSSTDAEGQTAQFVYDAIGNLVSATDPLGQTTAYEYDLAQRLVRRQYADSTAETFLYDRLGNRRATFDELGRRITYLYDGLNRQTHEIYPDGSFQRSSYDANGNVDARTNELGAIETFAYDEVNRLVTATDPQGNSTQFAYDGVGNLISTTDARGAQTVFEYDLLNRVTQVRRPEGIVVTNDYDANSNLVETARYETTGIVIPADPRTLPANRQRVTSSTYDVLDRLVNTTDPLGGTTSYTYDDVGNTLTSTDALGRITTYAYDQVDRLMSITDTEAGVSAFEYDAGGNLIASVDQLGRREEYEYDTRNRLVHTTDAMGGQSSQVRDAVGNPILTIDSLGRVTAFRYDKRDRLVEQIDAERGVTLFSYDDAGNLVQTVNPRGAVTTYEYDELNRRTKDTDALGGQTDYTYDAVGNLVEMSDPLGHVTSFAYDLAGRRTATTDALLHTSTTIYDSLSNVASNTDRAGRTTTYAYDNLDRLLTTTDALGGVSINTYDAVGNLRTSSDELGRITTFDYDDLDRLISTTDALSGETSYTYDAVGNVLTNSDERGSTTTFAYDDLNRPTEVTDPLGNTSTTAYDAVGNVLSVTDRLGRTSSFAYDGLDRRVRETNALGDSTIYRYDAASNLIATTDPLGRVTRYLYDPLNRLRIVEDPLVQSTFYTLDAVGNLTAVVDELGNLTRYFYDELDRVRTVVDPVGAPTFNTYDEVGNLLTVTDALGRVTTFTYDDLSRRLSMTDPLGNVTSHQYDAVGNLTTVTDALGNTTQYTFDDLNRLETTTDALGNTTTLEYDAAGNFTRRTDPLGNATQYGYDALNRQTTITDALSAVTTTAYDAAGNVLSITDPVGNTTSYQYDALDRVIVDTNELNDSRSYVYDEVGNFTQSTDRNGRVRTFAYDDADRQTEERWLDDLGDTVNLVTFEYDGLNRMSRAADNAATHRFHYDAASRLLEVQNDYADGPQVDLLYDRDIVGNVLSTTERVDGQERGSEIMIYDALNRVVSMAQVGEGVDDKRVDFTYDAVGQFTQINRYSDIAASFLVAGTNYTYDAVNRVTQITHADRNGAIINAFDYTYDAASRITDIVDIDGPTEFSYDAIGQLTQADATTRPDEDYTYDANGNRTGGGYTTGANNRLQTDGTYSYEYDAEGNLVLRTEIATGAVREFAYDHRNRLVSVTDRDSAGGPATQVVEYEYDAFDRRIARHMDADAAGPVAEMTERYVYDGDHVLLRFDAQGNLASRYLHGPVIDQVLAEENALVGQTHWTLADHQNTARDVANDAGNILNHLTYSSFGEVVAETDAAIDTLFGYTGREHDEATGLNYHRARWTDPNLGRFISEDPIGFAGGDANLYRYVENAPVVSVDPSGNNAVRLYESLAESNAFEFLKYFTSDNMEGLLSSPHILVAGDPSSVTNEPEPLSDASVSDSESGENTSRKTIPITESEQRIYYIEIRGVFVNETGAEVAVGIATTERALAEGFPKVLKETAETDYPTLVALEAERYAVAPNEYCTATLCQTKAYTRVNEIRAEQKKLLQGEQIGVLYARTGAGFGIEDGASINVGTARSGREFFGRSTNVNVNVFDFGGSLSFDDDLKEITGGSLGLGLGGLFGTSVTQTNTSTDETFESEYFVNPSPNETIVQTKPQKSASPTPRGSILENIITDTQYVGKGPTSIDRSSY